MKKRTYCRFSKLAKALRVARAAADVGQKEVANAIGYSQCSIHNHENGWRKPDNDALIAYAQYYGVPEQLFLDLAALDDAEGTDETEASVYRALATDSIIETLPRLSISDLTSILIWANQYRINATANEEEPCQKEL